MAWKPTVCYNGMTEPGRAMRDALHAGIPEPEKRREQVQDDLGQASGKDAKNPMPAGGDTLIYATSDVHGYPLDSFLRLLEKAGFGDEDTLYVLGDVIDRNGDGGIAMLRWMMDRPNVEFLLGNHEEMLLSCSFLFDEITDESIGHLDYGQMHLLLQWMRNGAQPTMAALRGLKKKDPEAATDLLDYLRDAPLYATASAGGKDYLLVHSGLEHFSPERKLSEYTPDELLWNRPSPDDRYFSDITTILGHTPTGYLFGEKGKMFRTDTWIDIDTGASGGGSPMLLRLDDLKAFYQISPAAIEILR